MDACDALGQGVSIDQVFPHSDQHGFNESARADQLKADWYVGQTPSRTIASLKTGSRCWGPAWAWDARRRQ